MSKDERFKIRVRRSKSRAVLCTVRRDGGDLVLERVEPTQGPMPEVGHLLGQRFPDADAVRRAVKAAMEGVVGDTLDNVLLTRRGYEMAMAGLQAAGEALRRAGVPLDAIGTERAKPTPEGDLLVWVDIPGGQRVEVVIPKGEWGWRKRPN